jgi:hypothetical protein
MREPLAHGGAVFFIGLADVAVPTVLRQVLVLGDDASPHRNEILGLVLEHRSGTFARPSGARCVGSVAGLDLSLVFGEIRH